MYERIPKNLTVDVLVIGGGLAGICAAIQAARLGCKTALAEKSLVLGGNSVPNGGVHPSGAHRFHAYGAETGIIEEITAQAAWNNAKTDTTGMHYNISQLWDKVLYDKLADAGVIVLRSNYARKPVMDSNRIKSVILEDTSTYHSRVININHVVIESSGDGHIAAQTGAEYSMGRESRDTFNERLAPEIADALTMGSSVVGLIHRTGHPVEFIPPADTPPFFPGYGDYPIWYQGVDSTCDIFIPTETGGQINTIEDEHEIYDKALKQIYSAWNYIKNEKYVEESKEWELVWVSPQVCKRESRRFKGDYVLTQSDVEEGRVFDDTIGYGGFALDIHYPKPEKSDYVKIVYYSIPPIYTIPYRSIYSEKIENLFFASRLLGVSHIAHGTARLQRTLSTVGQAAGAAASLCKKYSCKPRDIYLSYIPELQQLLLKEDSTIIGCTNNDKYDFARSAKVSASSECLFESVNIDSWMKLDRTRGIMLWDWTDKLDSIYFYFKNAGNHPVKVKAVLRHYIPEKSYKMPEEKRGFPYWAVSNEFEWGDDNRAAGFKRENEIVAEIPIGENWVGFEFNTQMSVKNPASDEERYIIEIVPVNDVSIASDNNYYDFVRRIESDDGANEYLAFPDSHLFKITPRPEYGEAGNVINGFNRRFSTNPVNMWIAGNKNDSLPQSVTLEWSKPIKISMIQLTFDTIYRAYSEMPLDSRKRYSGMCIRDYRIEAYIDCKWQKVCAVKDNYMRMRRNIVSPAITCDKIRISVEKMWSEKFSPRIYEIRVYGSDEPSPCPMGQNNRPSVPNGRS